MPNFTCMIRSHIVRHITRAACMLFTAYIFLLGSGLAVSHIHCDHGERWVLGAEMPPKKHQKHHGSKDNRQKETFHFFMKIDGETTTFGPEISQPIAVQSKQNTYATRSYVWDFANAKPATSNAPPERRAPKRSQLQVYII